MSNLMNAAQSAKANAMSKIKELKGISINTHSRIIVGDFIDL